MTASELGRALALLLLVALGLVAPSLTLVALDDVGLPWWWLVPQLVGYGAVVVVTARTVLTGRDLAAGHRVMWAVTVAASLTAPLALAGPAPLETVPLVAQVGPIAAAACAAGWRGWAALIPAVLLTVAQGLARAATAGPVGSLGDVTWAPLVEQAVFTLCLTTVSVIAIGAVRTSTDRLESTRDDARRSVVDTERASSRRLARIRWAASLHDDVLAVLRSVEAGHEPAADDRDAAARALATITARGGSQTWTTSSLADHLAHVVARVTPGAVTTARSTPGPVPPHVAEAVLAATVETVRNVVRHARTDGRCHVTVSAGSDRIEVTVRDDGVGFAPGHVPLGRLGLRVAARDRMRSVGGSATWASSPGAGTTVTLRWSPVVPTASGRVSTGTAGRPHAMGRSSWSLPAR